MDSNRFGSKNYFSGGLAEIVSKPTNITFSYLKKWFCGASSFGSAMQLLGLPYIKNKESILEIVDGQLYINLYIEEATLYKNTIFKYKIQKTIADTPSLTVSLPKLINPISIYNSTKILFVQSFWIANPQKYSLFANQLTENIPAKSSSTNTDEINAILKDQVWPSVIAVGMLAEFYNNLIQNESKFKYSEVQHYISSKVAKSDWFFKSLTEQEKVKLGHLTLEDYFKEYGIRADNDYELTFPRWIETKQLIVKRINNFKVAPQKEISMPLGLGKKLQTYIEAEIQLQISRSNAKHKALVYINQLRQQLISKKIIKVIEKVKTKKTNPRPKPTNQLLHNTGTPVSLGQVTGSVQVIKTAQDTIGENIIGIFPNASPQFSILYTKCIGMIFLKGGQTSHGAIVAREFGIPAIVDINAQNIKNGTNLTIDGQRGKWKINH